MLPIYSNFTLCSSAALGCLFFACLLLLFSILTSSYSALLGLFFFNFARFRFSQPGPVCADSHAPLPTLTTMSQSKTLSRYAHRHTRVTAATESGKRILLILPGLHKCCKKLQDAQVLQLCWVKMMQRGKK